MKHTYLLSAFSSAMYCLFIIHRPELAIIGACFALAVWGITHK